MEEIFRAIQLKSNNQSNRFFFLDYFLVIANLTEQLHSKNIASTWNMIDCYLAMLTRSKIDSTQCQFNDQGKLSLFGEKYI